jgi:hypothetical protein
MYRQINGIRVNGCTQHQAYELLRTLRALNGIEIAPALQTLCEIAVRGDTVLAYKTEKFAETLRRREISAETSGGGKEPVTLSIEECGEISFAQGEQGMDLTIMFQRPSMHRALRLLSILPMLHKLDVSLGEEAGIWDADPSVTTVEEALSGPISQWLCAEHIVRSSE